MKYKPRLSRLCSFAFSHRGITWSQTKGKAPRDVFLPAWDFDTCLAAANWNGSLSNEISARRMGREKKVTHYNYSTWLTELSHPCSPTFPLISFRDPAKVEVHVGVCLCTCVCLNYTEALCFSWFLFIYTPKLKPYVGFQWHSVFLSKTHLLTNETCFHLARTVNLILLLAERTCTDFDYGEVLAWRWSFNLIYIYIFCQNNWQDAERWALSVQECPVPNIQYTYYLSPSKIPVNRRFNSRGKCSSLIIKCLISITQNLMYN